MRLSEAIRLGAMLSPQTFGDFEIDGATCALGAAIEAAWTAGLPSDADAALGTLWPWVTAASVIPCPVCLETCRNVGYVIAKHLNDAHEWTRERIADWVETIEPRDTERREQPVLVGAVDPSGESEGTLTPRER